MTTTLSKTAPALLFFFFLLSFSGGASADDDATAQLRGGHRELEDCLPCGSPCKGRKQWGNKCCSGNRGEGRCAFSSQD